MKQKYYYLYKITNLLSNEFYIGVRQSTSLEDDEYLGSGVRILSSIKKYGKENFKKEILEFFNDSESLFLREAEIVNESLLKEKLCLNLHLGGRGGSLPGSFLHSKLSRKALQLKLDSNPEFRREIRLRVSEKLKNLHKQGKYKEFHTGNSFRGKSHSEETKRLMSEKKTGRCSGTDNSQFGTCWITNGVENKKIKKELPPSLEEGWYKGRKC